MIRLQPQTVVPCIDNSGVKKVRCIMTLPKKHPFGPSMRVFRGVVCSTAQQSQKTQKIRNSDLVLCLMLRSKRTFSSHFSENGCIILDSKFKPSASRIFGPVQISKSCSLETKTLISKLLSSKQDIFLV